VVPHVCPHYRQQRTSAGPSVHPLPENQCSASIFLRVLKCDWVGTKGFGSHKTSSLKPLLTAPKKKISSTKWWVFIGVLHSPLLIEISSSKFGAFQNQR
jgi:hypothetical protein